MSEAIKSFSPKNLEKQPNNLELTTNTLDRIIHLMEEKLLLLPKTGNQLFELKNDIETILNNLKTDKEYQQHHLYDLEAVLLQVNKNFRWL